MHAIQNTATVTSKGQITLPRFVRQALNLDTGSKLSFTLENGSIVLNRADVHTHQDPAISAFLHILEQDMRQGRHIMPLPPRMEAAMRSRAAAEAPETLEIDGEVSL